MDQEPVNRAGAEVQMECWPDASSASATEAKRSGKDRTSTGTKVSDCQGTQSHKVPSSSTMKLHLLHSTVILLAMLPQHDCRALESPGGPQSDLQHRTPPLLLRLGEESFLRVGDMKPRNPSTSLSAISRALQLHLSQRLLEENLGEGEVERGKRGEEPAISLDLTFHLLREVLQMARAEQLAQQAHSNRRIMDIFG
ncbi:corticoliberin [Arapaima gigas]